MTGLPLRRALTFPSAERAHQGCGEPEPPSEAHDRRPSRPSWGPRAGTRGAAGDAPVRGPEKPRSAKGPDPFGVRTCTLCPAHCPSPRGAPGHQQGSKVDRAASVHGTGGAAGTRTPPTPESTLRTLPPRPNTETAPLLPN